MNSVTEKNVNTAEEFWNLLTTASELFDKPNNLIYRGQSNADWPLKPSVFRNSKKPVTEFDSKEPTCDDQVFSEISCLRNFIDCCDRMGLLLPGDSYKFREEHIALDSRMVNKHLLNPSTWPHSDIFELMAMAQHNGLPTRLLDWSRFVYVAIYFAASDAIAHISNFDEIKNQRLAVWILNIESKGHFPNLKIINVPSGYNKNLAHQEGCFTLLRQPAERGKPFKGSVCHNEYLRTLSVHCLIKITVPVVEAVRLLELCDLQFISASKLFPDYRGAAQAVKDNMNKYIFNKLKEECDSKIDNQSAFSAEMLSTEL